MNAVYYFGSLPFIIGIIVAYINDLDWWEKREKEEYHTPLWVDIFYATTGLLSGASAIVYLIGACAVLSNAPVFAFDAIQGVGYLEMCSISGLWLSYVYHKKYEHEQMRKRG